MKQIAVCVSGCPRSWQKGLSTHFGFFEECERRWKESIQLTYFMVFWDFCCPSVNFEQIEDIKKKFRYSGDAREFRFPVSVQEQEEIIGNYRPEYAEFKKFEEMMTLDQTEWLYPSAYLMKEVLRQRRLYEKSRKEFDLCLWCRSDVEIEVNSHTNLPENPRGIVGDYLFRKGKKEVQVYTGFRDLFFYGRPEIVDLAASIYPQGVISREDPVYTDAGFIEEQYYKNLNYWGIPTESFNDVQVNISREFEENLLNLNTVNINGEASNLV